MNFDEFEIRLARVMRDTDIRTYVSVNNYEPDATVQFYVNEVVEKGLLLVAQINGNYMKVGSEQRAVDAGFVIDKNLSGQILYKEFEWPVRSADLREVTHTMVQALIDSGVTDPGLMTYRAWRYPQPLPDSWTDEEWEMFDHGENPLSIPALGLTADLSR